MAHSELDIQPRVCADVWFCFAMLLTHRLAFEPRSEDTKHQILLSLLKELTANVLYRHTTCNHLEKRAVRNINTTDRPRRLG